MKKLLLIGLLFSMLTSGCVVVPVKDEYVQNNQCLISSDRKVLKVIDLNGEGTGNYYSVSGTLVSPLTMAVSGLVSGAYVVTNNTYHWGEKKIKCDGSPAEPI